MRRGENENVRLLEIRGTAQPNDLTASLLEMSLTSELSRTDLGIYHAQMNPAIGEDKLMKDEDWIKSADILEKELKLTGQKRIIVIHQKDGRTHAHIAWERYDHDKGKMISDSKNYHSHDRARAAIEKVLEQKKTPKRNAKRSEMKVELTELWQKTRTAEQFLKKAEEKGYWIAISRESHPYRVIDTTGRDFDLLKQLDGVRVKEVREVFKEQKLPTKAQVFKAMRVRRGAQGFDFAQEKFSDKIDRARSQRAAQKEQQNSKKTLAEMKLSGKEQTAKSIDYSQEKFASILHHAKKLNDKIDKQLDRDEKIMEQRDNIDDITSKPQKKASDRLETQRKNADVTQQTVKRERAPERN